MAHKDTIHTVKRFTAKMQGNVYDARRESQRERTLRQFVAASRVLLFKLNHFDYTTGDYEAEILPHVELVNKLVKQIGVIGTREEKRP